MENIHLELWKDFITSFQKNISLIENKNLLGNKKETTSFYKNILFKNIAADLNLELLEKEYLRIDITLSKRGKVGNYLVPYIIVESENDSIGDLPNEIHKLLSLNAPLKVVLTRFDSLENELKNSYQNHEDTHWFYPIQDFIEFNRLDGIFAIISLERDSAGKLIISHICYDKNGIIGGLNSFYLI